MAEVIEMHPEGDVSVMVVPEADGLDEVTVFWQNYRLGQGKVTITCYGEAWTSGFWAMGDRTIQQFFKDGGWDYFVNKFSYGQHMKHNKQTTAYLTRIVKAVQAAL